jgi:MYXO-CTERM domain-containing protein
MRVQINRGSPRTGEGMDLFMSFWFMMTTAPGVRDNINYFESNGSNQNMMTWWVAPKTGGGNTVNYGTGSLGRTVQWTADFTLNQWHQLAWQIHWSVNATTGAVKMWYDGKQVLDIKAKTKADSNSMNMQTGFHRASPSSAVDSVFLDNYLEGESLEDIQITTTGASDGGVPADGGGAGTDAGMIGSGGSSGGEGSGGASGSGGGYGSGGSTVPPAGGSGGQAGVDASGGGVTAGGCAVGGGGGGSSSFAGIALGLLVVLRLRRRR